MQTFRVWAPLAQNVEIQMDNLRLPMLAEKDGWWFVELRAEPVHGDYGYYLDGAGPFPDPRSLWQPTGVQGLSRTFDHRSFHWTDAGWNAPPLPQAVIYELHVGTFTPEGTFDGVIDKLDYLRGLGVTHVEIMPVNEFSGRRGWGYDGVDFFAPHHVYGGPEGLKRLVDACHARQLAAILDVVYNHAGPVGNYLGRFGPYFSRRYTSAWGEPFNFDGAESGEVRRFFCDNALMWLRDYHFDGLRLDAVHGIVDTSAAPFLEQLGDEVRQLARELNRPLVLIPESDLNDPRLLWNQERGGFALDAQWSDDFHHALHTVLTGERQGYYADFGSLADLAKALRGAFVYDGRFSTHRRRSHGRPPHDLEGDRFLGYMQNHDQIGNRAKGERSTRLMSTGRLKMAAALVLTSPFIPLLFQGEEWGATTPFLYFTDHKDPALAEAVRQGRQREFAAMGWDPEEVPDPQARESFERSKLDWSEPSHPTHMDMLAWHRRLLELRRVESSLTDGRLDGVQVHYDESKRWLVVERGRILVACNLGGEMQTIPLPAQKARILMASVPEGTLENDSISLHPDSVVVLRI
jgi:maltooligosyltrehalose trehalohydrolase